MKQILQHGQGTIPRMRRGCSRGNDGKRGFALGGLYASLLYSAGLSDIITTTNTCTQLTLLLRLHVPACISTTHRHCWSISPNK